MDTTQQLREAVAQVIAESGLSMAQFARQADVSRKQIERLLAGEIQRPHDYTLRKIARGAGRDTEALIRVRDEGTPLADVSSSSDLERRVASLERQVADMASTLREVRDVMLPDREREREAP